MILHSILLLIVLKDLLALSEIETVEITILSLVVDMEKSKALSIAKISA